MSDYQAQMDAHDAAVKAAEQHVKVGQSLQGRGRPHRPNAGAYQINQFLEEALNGTHSITIV